MSRANCSIKDLPWLSSFLFGSIRCPDQLWKFSQKLLAVSAAIFLTNTPFLVERHPSPGRDLLYTCLAEIPPKDEAVPAALRQKKAFSVVILHLPNGFLPHHLHHLCIVSSKLQPVCLCPEMNTSSSAVKAAVA